MRNESMPTAGAPLPSVAFMPVRSETGPMKSLPIKRPISTLSVTRSPLTLMGAVDTMSRILRSALAVPEGESRVPFTLRSARLPDVEPLKRKVSPLARFPRLMGFPGIHWLRKPPRPSVVKVKSLSSVLRPMLDMSVTLFRATLAVPPNPEVLSLKLRSYTRRLLTGPLTLPELMSATMPLSLNEGTK